jgi:hypothetical protein
MENKKQKCPHLEKCKQQIVESDANLCEELIDDQWSFDDCFKYNDLQANADYGPNHHKKSVTKTPKEWLSLLERN